MSSGTVSVRYARALILRAVELGEEAQVYAEMRILSERLRHVPEIHKRIVDPTVQTDAKCLLLETAVTDGKGSVSASLHEFLNLVVKAGRGDMLLFMAVSYMDMYRELKGIMSVNLTTAVPVGDDRKEHMRRLVESVRQGELEWTETTDPAIEGGFILQIEGYRLDASVRTQLERIRKELIDKNNRII